VRLIGEFILSSDRENEIWRRIQDVILTEYTFQGKKKDGKQPAFPPSANA
jgi:hypothetical protein